MEDLRKKIEIVVPTEEIELPSKGILYKNKTEKIKIRSLIADDDDILYSTDLIKNGKVFDALLNAVILEPNIDVKELIIGDKNYILLALRILSIGEIYKPSEMECPSCRIKFKPEIDLTKLEKQELTEMPDENGEFTVILPLSKKTIKFRFLNGYDEDDIERNLNLTRKNIKGQFKIQRIITERYKRQIMEVDGVRDKFAISEFVEKMPFKDALFFKIYLKKINPGFNMEYEFSCYNCGYQWKSDIPIDPSLFYITEEE